MKLNVEAAARQFRPPEQSLHAWKMLAQALGAVALRGSLRGHVRLTDQLLA
jgi:hypothetical protein